MDGEARVWRTGCGVGAGAAMSKRRCGVKSLSLEERFWSKVDMTGECWLWVASIHPSGYGAFSFCGEMVPAHRMAWELQHGPIPTGLWVLHSCEASYAPGDRTCRRCVRHLYLGTCKDNARDASMAGRWSNRDRTGEHNGRAKLSAAQVEEIRATYKPRVTTYRALAVAFGVSPTTICDVVTGKKWAA